MAKKITLDQLSAEDKAALLADLRNEEAAKEDKVREERKVYKAMVNETVPLLFNVLKEVAKALSDAKTYVYDNLESLVKMKAEVYGRESEQTSHTFTTDDGTTIIIGYRQSDGWDDTVSVGITKVNDYVQSLGRDANSKALVKTLLQLLAKDKTGNLKASRVLQLKKLAEETGDAGFKDAIQIIQDAYRPNRSRQFVTARFKDEKGAVIELPLSITDAELNQQAKQ